MAKNKYKQLKTEAEEVPITDENKMTEAIEALKAQVTHHNTMLIKAQGALEVLSQLIESTDDTKATN
tara:strand:- start:599 stop:799 length:201 start_codon:yes stop_codon:yes gene_type:complete